MYGIGGKVYIWLKIYLANRTQRVMYKKCIFFYGTNSCRCTSRLRTWATTISNSCNLNGATRFCRLFTDDNCLHYSSNCVKPIENCQS